ncbi:hypothetical protein C173_05411 [Paenibacillus sp. FSL R7-277]|uniref:DUF4179 domain-containing protein n=1 Tax=Paenibacillus sp. FSL R7-277 TaxID=1227352 RepID=UPI0003E21558|nr:DUF4179 domain-containing protein [Paenibacillus sp. FSL R7-277]ETT77252.1 hypothetical protein C173_05411 [Paenibacillus sp. FSL R7-277]
MFRMKWNELGISHTAQMQPKQEQKQGSAPNKRRSSRNRLSTAIVAVMTTAALVLSPFAVTGQALAASATAAKPSAALAPFVNPEIQGYRQVEYAIKHNLVQPLNTVVKKDGYQLTVNGFIADKYELIILFTAQADSKRAFVFMPSKGHSLQLSDAITGKVISGKKFNDALVIGASPAKKDHILYGIAKIPLSSPLTTPPKKVAAQFQLGTLTAIELNQLKALDAEMLAAAEKAHADDPDQTSSFSYSPELLKKYDALKSNVKYSPVLKVAFDINPKVWKQETRTLMPEETIDVAGHKIKVKLELTPFTTVTTLSSDEALFKNREFMETFYMEYNPSLLVKNGTGDYKSQEGASVYTYADHEMKIVSESYFFLNKPQSLRLDFTNMKDRKITQQLIVDMSKQ